MNGKDAKAEQAQSTTSNADEDTLKRDISDPETYETSKKLKLSVSTSSENTVMNGASDNIIPSEIVSEYLKLDRLPSKVGALSALSNNEKKELENCLQIGKNDWRADWIGNLAYADKDISNPDRKSREKGRKPLFRWAERGKVGLKLLNNLLRYVHHLKETPKQAKKVLVSADSKSAQSIQDAVRRVSYDPIVLRQDGWTTAKSSTPIGASGGPHRIGEMVFWQGFAGVIIAYIHDDHLGDLWKAMWLEEFDTFDLEAEELDDAKRKYERRKKLKEQKMVHTPTSSTKQYSSTDISGTRRSGRYSAAAFSPKGIEHGIVLAVSYSRGSRPGVFWPARVMHFSEMQSAQSKRGSQKHKVDVVFLAPYWNAAPNLANNRKESYSESLSRHGSSIFSAGPLFELETIDASYESIQEYPYDGSRGLDIDQLMASFKFVGLPKAAFSRFIDAHRLALGLKTFSQKVMKSTSATDDLHLTTAGLFEAHPIAAQTASYPSAVLDLPFDHILSKMPATDSDDSDQIFDDMKSNEEPVLQLGAILKAMEPPNCWGLGKDDVTMVVDTPTKSSDSMPFASPSLPLSLDFADGKVSAVTLDRFTAGLVSLNSLLSDAIEDESSMSALLSKNLNQLLVKIPNDPAEFECSSTDTKRGHCKALIKLWIVVKTHGEELIASLKQRESLPCLVDWRKVCERVYKYITVVFSSKGVGNSVSWVLTDSLCNQHITSNGCFERAVRLPAAVKAAREAGAGKCDRIQLMTAVKLHYLEIAEKQVIRRAHKKPYLQRIKKRCLSVVDDRDVVPLTEDSDGNGGEDTKGSRGSWKAAVAGVGAAVQAVDMIMNGECVNAFSVTRPPGHHAGKELHAMKAVSNGFCLLNSAACAALYATSPISEGGPGLRRVCVIDIDVHHGNGTQDILCSTYDPRFFYVSLHAGGPDVNGLDPGEADELAHHLGRQSKKGIFPGRCGDSSPHDGVLNIPLGSRVTSHALGTALVTKVTPAVEKFSPELIIISTGFDAHMNDPLGLGGLTSEDFGTLTEVICKLAHKSCSGRVLSVLEGGYGVPCCRLPANLFDPEEAKKRAAMKNRQSENPSENTQEQGTSDVEVNIKQEPKQKPLQLLDLGEDLPQNMPDEVPYILGKRLDKCHQEGFMQCVRDHILALSKSSDRN